MSMTVAAEARAASAPTPALTVAAQSRWLCNGVAAAPDGTLFLGLPRFPDHTATPSLVRVEPDGALSPFPGGTWNAWSQGGDGREAFVTVNAVHVFNDGTLWVVDQGAVGGQAVPGGPKIVRIDPRTGTVLAVLRFGDDILPAGAAMNDLRLHDHMLYVTDSGLGGLIVHDLAANRTLRRLSGHPLLHKPEGAVQKGQGGRILADAADRHPAVASDMIELDADGAWLYWATPTGPVRRIATALLTDESLTDADLAAAIQTIAEIPTIGGTAMDTLGNLYLSDAENRRIAVLTPQGRMLTLVQDDRLVSPDAICIDGQRRLLVPASQLEDLASGAGGDDRTRAPWQVLALPLPRELAGLRLGEAVTGRSPPRGLSNIHGIEHVAMTVPDMEAAIRFLQEAFGATVLYRHLKLTDEPLTAADVGRINGLPETATLRGACQMRLGDGANIELFQLTGIARTEAAEINDIGLNHFSLFVDDIALATERFAAAGGTLLEGPNDLGLNETGAGNQLWFGRMPWGTWVEFMTFRSPLRYDAGATQERRFPARG